MPAQQRFGADAAAGDGVDHRLVVDLELALGERILEAGAGRELAPRRDQQQPAQQCRGQQADGGIDQHVLPPALLEPARRADGDDAHRVALRFQHHPVAGQLVQRLLRIQPEPGQHRAVAALDRQADLVLGGVLVHRLAKQARIEMQAEHGVVAGAVVDNDGHHVLPRQRQGRRDVDALRGDDAVFRVVDRLRRVVDLRVGAAHRAVDHQGRLLEVDRIEHGVAHRLQGSRAAARFQLPRPLGEGGFGGAEDLVGAIHGGGGVALQLRVHLPHRLQPGDQDESGWRQQSGDCHQGDEYELAAPAGHPGCSPKAVLSECYAAIFKHTMTFCRMLSGPSRPAVVYFA